MSTDYGRCPAALFIGLMLAGGGTAAGAMSIATRCNASLRV